MSDNPGDRIPSFRRGKEIAARVVGVVARSETWITSKGTPAASVHLMDDGVLQGPIIVAIPDDVALVAKKPTGKITIETKPPGVGYEHPIGRITHYDEF